MIVNTTAERGTDFDLALDSARQEMESCWNPDRLAGLATH